MDADRALISTYLDGILTMETGVNDMRRDILNIVTSSIPFGALDSRVHATGGNAGSAPAMNHIGSEMPHSRPIQPGMLLAYDIEYPNIASQINRMPKAVECNFGQRRKLGRHLLKNGK